MTYYLATAATTKISNPDTGLPLAGGRIEAYHRGTRIPADMYSGSGGVKIGSAVRLNALGQPEISGSVTPLWLATGTEYEFVLKDAAALKRWTADSLSYWIVSTEDLVRSRRSLLRFIGATLAVSPWLTAPTRALANGVGLGTFEFDSVQGLKDGITSTGIAVNFSLLATARARAKTIEYFRGTSIGGTEYVIKALEQHRADIGNSEWVPDEYGDHYVGDGTTYIAVLHRHGCLQPEWFGALGNWKNTNGADDAPSFAALFGSVGDGEKAIVELDPGRVYRWDSRLSNGPVASRRISIQGNGARVHLTGTGGLDLRNDEIIVERIKFTQDPGVAKSAVPIVDSLNVRGVVIRELTFENVQHAALQVRSGTDGACDNIIIENCTFDNCSSGDIRIIGSNAESRIKNVLIKNCTFKSPFSPLDAGDTQIRAIHIMEWTEHVIISDCAMYGVADAFYTQGWRDGIMIGNSSSVGRPENILVDNCSITGMSDDAIGISGARNVTIRGCKLYNSQVTAGVYAPTSGGWSNESVKIAGCTIFGHPLAGIYLKDTLHYKITNNRIYSCREGITCVDEGSGVAGGDISHNEIRSITSKGITPTGARVTVIGNIIDGFGDLASVLVTDKMAVLVECPGAYKNNVIMNGPIALLYTNSPNNFVVEGNTGRGVNTAHYFIDFGGDRYAIKNNIIDAVNMFSGEPSADTTKVFADNI